MCISQLEILLIEDDPTDIFFVEKATKASKYVKSFHVAHNGVEAVKYLKGEAPFEDREKHQMPNVILCDIKMPLMDGFAFLKWLQAHRECNIIPVIIYSSSDMEEDIKKAYQLGANAYFQKPISMDEMLDFLHFAYEFWSRCKCPALPNSCK